MAQGVLDAPVPLVSRRRLHVNGINLENRLCFIDGLLRRGALKHVTCQSSFARRWFQRQFGVLLSWCLLSGGGGGRGGRARRQSGRRDRRWCGCAEGDRWQDLRGRRGAGEGGVRRRHEDRESCTP